MSNVETFPSPAKAESAGESFRTKPHNLEAEAALLGAILVNNEAFYRVSDFLEAAHFFDELHGRIYQTAGQLVRLNKVATPITLKTYFGDETVADMPTAQYLARLAAEATSIINAADYGRTIYELAIRRGLIDIGEDLVTTAYEAGVEDDPAGQIDTAERALYELAEKGRYDGGFQRFEDALATAVEMAAAAYERDGGLSGTATGLIDLDQRMGGLQRSDLVILAGRPAMGKTALVTNIAYNVAKAYQYRDLEDGSRETTNGGQVGFFSLEMSAEQLATRIIAEQTEIPSNKIRRGDITRDEFERVVEKTREMASVPFYIDQTGGISIAQLAARARRLKRQKGLDLIVVDYLQLLSGSSKKSSENRVQEITEITTSLKALAKELNLPVIALSQLSRQVEARDDKRPQLADLRESGSIEQDADVVMFVYREEYYLERKKPKEGTEDFMSWEREITDAFGKAEVIIAKQRHGPTGTVEVQFEKEFTRFGNLARQPGQGGQDIEDY